MTKPKSFRCKIPTTLHPQIFEWYCCGLTAQAILAKLQSELNHHTNGRTLSRLLKHLKEEKQAITSAVIADQTQNQVAQDFQELNSLFTNLKELAKVAYKDDNNLYLRCVDRLTRLLQIKFAITTKEEQSSHETISNEELLDGLISKLGTK